MMCFGRTGRPCLSRLGFWVLGSSVALMDACHLSKKLAVLQQLQKGAEGLVTLIFVCVRIRTVLAARRKLGTKNASDGIPFWFTLG